MDSRARKSYARCAIREVPTFTIPCINNKLGILKQLKLITLLTGEHRFKTISIQEV